MAYTPMTDDEWEFHKECGLLERDGSIYACTICGKELWSMFLNPWPFRCWDCDPDREWFWSHYNAWEDGYRLGRKSVENSEKL